jgi:Right handed beta helix region
MTSRGKLKPILRWLLGAALFGEIVCSAPRILLAAQIAVTKACNAPTLPLTGSVVQVSTEAQLQAAISNLQPGTTILIANGIYNLSSTLYISNVNNVTIRGASGCDNVVLIGRGMTNDDFGNVPYGIWSDSSNTVIAHLTIRDVYFHPIIFNPGAQQPRIYSVRLKNGGEQLIKGNPSSSTEGINNGIVEYSIMEFDTTSRDFYTNAVDVHTGRNWIIRDNLFRNIRAPEGQLAGPAVLMWNGSSNTIVERNLFLNTQRGIAFGLQERAPNDHSGGIIRNNIFFRKAGETGDTGIHVADSPNTKVLHNTVILNGTYPFAIEYRFPDTTGVEIRFNLTDAQILSRDGATGNVANNIQNASSDMFVDPANNDLHLRSTAALAIDAAPAHPDVTDDYDGQLRPTSGASPRDLGADEFISGLPSSLVAAVLPSSRSVQVGATATAFATIINAGSATAILCAPALVTGLPAAFTYQTTDPSTNQVIGSANTPISVGAGAIQSFVIALTPTGPIAPTDVQFSFDCANTDPAPINIGLNTLLLSASVIPVPDIVALAATATNDGIVNIPGTNGTGAFAVATVNVGAGGSITASADTGSASLPLSIFLCETNPATAQCISAIGPSVTTQINANATPTFAILVQGNGNVPFDPAANRIFVRFKDSGNVTRGSTSVAVRTQ